MPTVSAVLLFGAAFVFNPETNLEDVGQSYFAPMSLVHWRGRFPDGEFRFFENAGTSGNRRVIRSPDGWTGAVDGRKATVRPSEKDRSPQGVTEYRFEDGVLVGLVQGGKLSKFNCPAIMPTPGMPPPLARAREDFRPDELDTDIWKGSRRLRFGYKNPNCCGALMAELAVLTCALLLLRRRIWVVHGCLLLLSALLLMGRTESRGALLAFGLAVVVALISYGRVLFRALSLKKVIGFSFIGLVTFGTLYFGGYCERFTQTARNRHSDQGRTETLARIPEMIACAPGGWNEPVAGMTYTMWFQDFSRKNMVKDMMNEHLTFLVMHSWPVRFAYLFGWLAVLMFLIGYIRRGGSPVPLGLWVVQGVTAALNRTFASPTLWILPVCGLLWALYRANWRLDWRLYAKHVCIAALLAAAGLIAVQIGGLSLSARHVPRIRSNGRQVTINGTNPIHWVVDEPTVLLPILAGKEIRLYYRRHPDAPALGFVRRFEDLPRDAQHVTLFGRSCERFLEQIRLNPNGTLPSALTLISPTVAPAKFSANLRKRCNVKIVLGTLLARYFTDDGTMPDWVTLVPGAEIYIPGWMRFCVN